MNGLVPSCLLPFSPTNNELHEIISAFYLSITKMPGLGRRLLQSIRQWIINYLQLHSDVKTMVNDKTGQPVSPRATELQSGSIEARMM